MKSHIDILNQLLNEASSRKNEEDNKRINIIVVGSAIDEHSLNLVQQAATLVDRPNGDDADISLMAKRKALADEKDNDADSLATSLPTEVKALSKSELVLTDAQLKCSRFVTSMRESRQLVVFEKKKYDADIAYEQKQALLGRLRRLILLMANPTSVRIPQAKGYISHPENSYWWLVFSFEPRAVPTYNLPAINVLLTLTDLLRSNRKEKPSLNFRVSLSRTFCATVSALYFSSWLHKSLRKQFYILPGGCAGR